MAELKSRAGGCQCGAVRYTVEIDQDVPVTSCNCSMCGKAGTLLSFVPASRFRLERGGEALTDYLFNRHHIHHLFCRRCGIKSFARGSGPEGKEMVAVNVRCLDGFEPEQFRVQPLDGRSH